MAVALWKGRDIVMHLTKLCLLLFLLGPLWEGDVSLHWVTLSMVA